MGMCAHGVLTELAERNCPDCLRAKIAQQQERIDRIVRLGEQQAEDMRVMQVHLRGNVAHEQLRADLAEARVAELERQRFTDAELRRISDRVLREPRNGQDIGIDAKCRAALRAKAVAALARPAPAKEPAR